ncbi:hypothetical protein AST03_13405 [Staphylococcus equorum]|uniref:hypothetical protein n=1 Tax=Staphylococcus equorum TaxID=246432 RepID=UPI000853B6F2|nr:hypothetical protein [Staphylococcus equorum]OEK72258.1 hypothetical protein AST03_13405 [Staphylococcus equorum]
MVREIPHRYLQDNDGGEYFPVTSGKAIEELDKAASIVAINEKIAEINDKMKLMDLALGDMVGDTGWIDIEVPTATKNKAQVNGFQCGIREVRAGNSIIPNMFIVRSIRLNVSNITGDSMQIAQLPTGFVTNNQSFIARGYGYSHPITIECLSDGKVTAFVHTDDQSKNNWIYQEFTWLE